MKTSSNIPQTSNQDILEGIKEALNSLEEHKEKEKQLFLEIINKLIAKQNDNFKFDPKKHYIILSRNAYKHLLGVDDLIKHMPFPYPNNMISLKTEIEKHGIRFVFSNLMNDDCFVVVDKERLENNLKYTPFDPKFVLDMSI